MPSEKLRLYVALYPSGVVNKEERNQAITCRQSVNGRWSVSLIRANRYHWGLLVGPKKENSDAVPGMRYHVKNTPTGWKYEEIQIENVRTTINLLARIVIAKVEDNQRLKTIIRNLPVVQDDSAWRCRTWIKSALAELERDGKAVGTSQLDWKKIEDFARQYVAQKTATGRYDSEEGVMGPKPTWDLLEGKETVA